MKRILLIFCALLTMEGMWATEFNNYIVTYTTDGTFFNQSGTEFTTGGWIADKWVSNADGKPVVTIQSNTANDNSMYVDNGTMGFGRTYTISVAGDYFITGYIIHVGSVWDNKSTITPAAGGSAVTFNSTDDVLTVSGLKTTSTSFTNSTGNLVSPTIEVYLVDKWSVNFVKSQTFTRSDRHINSVTFTSAVGSREVTGLYENTSTPCYQDLTASKTVSLTPSTSVKPSFSMSGGWQHGFVYIDLNNDGDFTDDGELVSYYNQGNPNLSTAMPAFTTPATGTYRMRIKSDWSSTDPGGNTASGNYIIDNGGMIVDLTLEIVEDYTDVLNAITKSFTDYPAESGYFRMNSTAASNLTGMITTASSNDGIIDAEEYAALLGYFESAVRFPTTGYYLIKNSNSNRNLAYGTPGESGKDNGLITTDGSLTPANIIRLTKVGLNEYTISSQGLNVQARAGANNTFTMSASEGVVFSFAPQNDTNLKISNTDSNIGTNNPGTLFEAHWTAPYAVVNWEPSGTQGQWTIEDATSVTVSLNAVDGKSYATFCAPFDVTIGDGATAYTVTLDMVNNKAIYTAITDNKVPAGAGVLIISDNAESSVIANINTTGTAFTALENNALVGYYLPEAYTAEEGNTKNLVLGVASGSGIGFYQMGSATASPNKAYLPYTGTFVKGFSLMPSDEETGISTVANESEKNNVYDLSGRRVAQPTKGLYIINGKKVLVK